MAEFIVNPRRAPRAPARCRAAVVHSQGRFEAETEDIGSMGCQVVSPRAIRKGEPVELLVTNPRVDEPLGVVGRVAWVSAREPWRVGIAFDAGELEASARWFDRLLEAYPGLRGYRRVPERIRTDATLHLGPPPRFLLDFTGDEALLLRSIASGARVDELMARFRDGWPAAQRALFSLLARQAVTLERGQAVHPTAWRSVLAEIEASLAVESLGDAGPAAPPAARPPARPARPAPEPPAGPRATPPPIAAGPPSRPAAKPAAPPRTPPPVEPGWAGVPPQDPRVLELELEDDGSPVELELDPEPRPASAGAGPHVPRGARPAVRSAAAQAAYDRGVAALRSGDVGAAIALLRQALALAPADAEIGQQLGTLAARARLPRDR
jgi:hypothetical protein